MTSPATYRLNPFVASLFGGRGVASNPSNPESIFTASDDTPQKKTQAALDKLEKAVADIQSGDNFREWLKVAGRFHKYSIGNQMLIWLQRPKSSRVAGFNTWKQLGRFVKSGEKGIAILVPAGVGRRITAQSELESFTARRTKKYIDSGMDGEEAKQKAESDAADARSFKQTFRFITGYVFDIDQTTGRPLPEFDVPELKGDDSKVLFDKLVLYAQRRRNIPVIFDPKRDPQNGTQGYYSPTENIIWI
ncbi:MAG: ArdC family protein, partial [Dehalococcoidia bacterium]|nr:ArdC family protein [Dehalococcoidia bacterium]